MNFLCLDRLNFTKFEGLTKMPQKAASISKVIGNIFPLPEMRFIKVRDSNFKSIKTTSSLEVVFILSAFFDF